jgi:hypothetical protein
VTRASWGWYKLRVEDRSRDLITVRIELMRQRKRHSTIALIAALGVFTALVAPAIACGFEAACPVRSASPHCDIVEGGATCGATSMTSAPPLCCTSEAKAPAGTLRDAAPTRLDWTRPVPAAPVSTTSPLQLAKLRLNQTSLAPSPPPRDTLSLNSTLLL